VARPGADRQPRFALKPGLTLYAMADGSAVLASEGEAHAINAEAAALLGIGERWTERDLRGRMLATGVEPAAAGDLAGRFVDQLRSIGVIVSDDG
jgi:hypothetical protein